MYTSLQTEDVENPDFNATKWADSLQTAIAQLADLRMDGMHRKASEPDPQKRIYGPAMSAKVLSFFLAPCSSLHAEAALTMMPGSILTDVASMRKCT